MQITYGFWVSFFALTFRDTVGPLFLRNVHDAFMASLGVRSVRNSQKPSANHFQGFRKVGVPFLGPPQ